MGNVKDYYDQFNTCREHDAPLCVNSCPFGLDILELQRKTAAGRINAAYKCIRDAVVFPGIVSEICPAYCQGACLREDIDSAVRLKLLEKSIIACTGKREPNAYNLPAKKGRIAVVGAGISGMGFALKMAARKYDVTVYEKTGAVGGRLAELLPEEVYLPEIELQFKNEKYTLKLNTEIDDINEMCGEGEDAFDVIYVATGKDGFDPGITGAAQIGKTAVYTGGGLRGRNSIYALVEGIAAAQAAEAYLKTGKITMPELPEIEELPEVTEKEALLSEEECVKEAERCLRCKCDACETYCDLVDYFDAWPVKMRDEIFLSVKPAGSLVHKCPARKYIAACTGCDIMKDVCPEGIDLCGMIKTARHKMNEVGKMPAAYKQYYIRDMEHANGDSSALKKFAPGHSSCKYAFFPGCSLAALNPDYVIKPYKWLLSAKPDTGLLLRCCNIPLDWDGNTKAHEDAIAGLRADWNSLGKPKLITACMSCGKHLKEYLPEIETVSLYEIMAEEEYRAESEGKEVYSIFDPCAARGEDAVQLSIRKLAAQSGICVEELPKGDSHGCCGYGGQGAMVEPGFAKYAAEKNGSLSENPYIVYCGNCKDVFGSNGKRNVHILDILFDIDKDGTEALPGVTQRRLNRECARGRLLEELWGEEYTAPALGEHRLKFEEGAQEKAEKQRILEEDICQVISRGEASGRRCSNPETGRFKAYDEIGAITLWVEYTVNGSEATVYNVYSHRMKIKLEAVFNGQKIDGE